MFKSVLVSILIILSNNPIQAVTHCATYIKIRECQNTPKLNNNGFVCGTIYDTKAYGHTAFIYDSRRENMFFLAFDSSDTWALTLNNNDEIIGYYIEDGFSAVYGKTHQYVPFIWSKNKGFFDLRYTFGQTYSNSGIVESLIINDSGWCAVHSGNESILWDGKIPEILKETAIPTNGVCAKAINNNGDVAGCVYYRTHDHTRIDGPSYAFLSDKRARELLPLGNLGGHEKFYSCATDLNDSMQVVGLSEVNIKHNGRYCYHAFVWENGEMTDLGVLEPYNESKANAINSHGIIVGTSGERAFIWHRDRGIIDLNTLVDADATIWEAFDINDCGQILCKGRINGKSGYFLLTPNP